jgi:hypothetical protein
MSFPALTYPEEPSRLAAVAARQVLVKLVSGIKRRSTHKSELRCRDLGVQCEELAALRST